MPDAQFLTKLYESVDNLTRLLDEQRNVDYAALLRHRLHEVAWTSPYELLEELSEVLARYVAEPPAYATDQTVRQVRVVLADVQAALRSYYS